MSEIKKAHPGLKTLIKNFNSLFAAVKLKDD